MKDHRDFVVTENGLLYKVIAIKEVNYSRAKKGTIERFFKNNPDPEGWLVYYTDFHVTVRNDKENFDRVFVYTEQEAMSELFIN